MTRSITARNVFEKLQHKLKLHWLSQEVEGYSLSADDLTARPDLVGFLNLIHPNRFQVLGSEEIELLTRLLSDRSVGEVRI